MNKFARNTLLAAGLALGAAGSAYADSFASAILDINNFRLLHSSGAAYSSTDFLTLTGTNDAHATASLNGVFANDAQSFGILSGTNPDVAQQCVGAPCPPIAENNFTPFPFPPPVPGTFGYADQNLTGSSITIGLAPAGAHAQTRAEASLEVNGVASGNSDVGTSTTFSFTLGAADTMTVSFDGTPFTQAFVDTNSPTTNSNARLSWSINIRDTATGAIVFSYAPSEINEFSNVSRTDGSPGLTTYDPGTMAFSATSPVLTAGVVYEITIQHNTLANALQEVPEPASLAIFGIGLLGLTVVTRRRKS